MTKSGIIAFFDEHRYPWDDSKKRKRNGHKWVLKIEDE